MNEDEEFEFRARAEKEQRMRSASKSQEQASVSSDEPPPSEDAQPPSMGDVAKNIPGRGAANFLNTPHAVTGLLLRGLSSLPGSEHIQIPGMEGENHLQQLADRFGKNRIMDLAEQSGAVDPEVAKNMTGPQRIVDSIGQAAMGAVTGPQNLVLSAAREGAKAAAKAGVRAAGVGGTAGGVGQSVKEFADPVIGDAGSTLLAVAAGTMVPMGISGVRDKSSSFIGTKTKKELLKEMRAEGYVVEPAAVHSGRPTEILESFGGKAPVAQLASIKNQSVTNDLAMRSIGLPKGTEVTPAVLHEVQEKAGEVYRQISDISPRAAQALKDLKEARFKSNDWWRYYNKGGDPKAGDQARKWQAKSDQLEGIINEEANKIVEVWQSTGRMSRSGGTAQGGTSPQFVNRQGLPTRGPESIEGGSREVGFPTPSGGKGELVTGAKQTTNPGKYDTLDMEKVTRTQGDPHIIERLRDARKLIARTHDIERALIEGPGEVSAPALAAMKKAGRPLGGELDLIARAGQGFGRSMRAGSTVPPPSVSGTDAITGMLLGGTGSMAFGPTGALLTAIPLLRKPARELVLSKMIQDHLLKEAPRTPVGTTMGRSATTANTLFQNNQNR